MSSQYVSPDQLENLLKNNHTFTFKSKFTGWYIFFLFLAIVFGIILTIFVPFGVIILILGISIVIIWIFYDMSSHLILTPENIILKRGNKINYTCSYNQVYNIEFFIRSTTVDNVSSRENKFKIITNSGRTKVITADYWVTPKPLPTDIFIKTILTYYFQMNKTLQNQQTTSLQHPTSNLNFCPKCGNNIIVGSKYCENCGYNLETLTNS